MWAIKLYNVVYSVPFGIREKITFRSEDKRR